MTRPSASQDAISRAKSALFAAAMMLLPVLFFVLAEFALRTAEFGIGDWANEVPADVARPTVLVTPLDTTLAGLHVRRLRNNWPFQPPGVTRSDTIRVDHPIEMLAVSVLQGKETWLSATASAGSYFEQAGQLNEALRVAPALIQEEPYRDQPYLLAGNLRVKQERFRAAYEYFSAAEARRPSAEARRMMGHVLLRSGRPTEAVLHLERALELSGDSEAVLFDLAVAYAESRRVVEARRAAEKLVRTNPESARARHLLARFSGDRTN